MLWVNSHEACPDWLPPPDEAAADSYLGNGYFPTWCLDVVERQLVRAAGDRRLCVRGDDLDGVAAAGEFRRDQRGVACVSRRRQRRWQAGTGRSQCRCRSSMFWGCFRIWATTTGCCRRRTRAGTGSADLRRAMIGESCGRCFTAHQPEDTQSRSEAAFDVSLKLGGLAGDGAVRVSQWHFDREHNSPFRAARALRERAAAAGKSSHAHLAALVRGLESGDRAAQRAALESVPKLDAAGRQAVAPAILKLAGEDTDQVVREIAKETLKAAFTPMAYSRAEVEEIAKLCECHSTGTGVRGARRMAGFGSRRGWRGTGVCS